MHEHLASNLLGNIEEPVALISRSYGRVQLMRMMKIEGLHHIFHGRFWVSRCLL
jgi:hypothetical protein